LPTRHRRKDLEQPLLLLALLLLPLLLAGVLLALLAGVLLALLSLQFVDANYEALTAAAEDAAPAAGLMRSAPAAGYPDLNLFPRKGRREIRVVGYMGFDCE
jgi:hypothetical protein